jgi:hypothetical protein
MSEALHRLVYYSRNLIPGDAKAIASEIDGILTVSRRNNQKVGITGALIFNAGAFAQVLEGPRSAIEQTFERIQRDERHSDVMVLAFAQAAKHDFPSWSMAFVGRATADRNLFSHIAALTAFDEKRLEGDRIHSILRELVLEDETRAVV